jgi:antirestriction protein ArdC
MVRVIAKRLDPRSLASLTPSFLCHSLRIQERETQVDTFSQLSVRGPSGLVKGPRPKKLLGGTVINMSNCAIYEKVNALVLTDLESGVAPWRVPYKWGVPTIGTNKSVNSGESYTGANAFFTYLVALLRGYESNLWGTFKAWSGKGRYVCKGEKGTPIIYFQMIDVKSEGEEPKKIPMARYYIAFNECQLEDYVSSNQDEIKTFPKAEDVIKGSKVSEIEIMRGFPAYSPKEDFIFMPPKDSFKTTESYYATLFHEYAHATGHGTRLNRYSLTKLSHFGSHDYSKEELVAELTSAYLMAHCGLVAELDQSSAYIENWFKVLKKDPSMFVSASSSAQKAFEYIVGNSQQ